MPAVFAGTGLACLALSIWTASAIERFSRLGVRKALSEGGYSWAEVETDGLKVILRGTAPTEAMRFRALLAAENVVDAARLRDEITVAAESRVAVPDFTIQILRNDDGISLIGLVPASMDRTQLTDALKALAGGKVTDMLESADHPAPDGWDATVAFAESAVTLLPRAKVSVSAGKVAVTAISESEAEQASLESSLRRKVPAGLDLQLNITAPHPVIAPFTVRFLIDKSGARFDACSADSDTAQAKILAAAAAAGAGAGATCPVGLGVPTPTWADAVVMGLKAVTRLGRGAITFSDADVTLVADPEVKQVDFDRVVGELESNLPDIFSLKATIASKADGVAAGAAEFVATLDKDGKVDLSGRVGDDMTRKAVESVAAARFGTANVHAATRLASGLPAGWGKRVLVGLEALAELDNGTVTVHEGTLRVEGASGRKEASGSVSRILDSRLGSGTAYSLAIRYDKALDKTLGLPTPAECVSRINAALAARKIAFDPGSAVISPDSGETLDKIAAVMKNCGDVAMEVGGHTDSQGRDEMNLVLSQQRAQSVIEALLTRRVLTGNLTARGYGETQPVMANDTEANREQNRRIEFRLIGKDGQPVDPAAATAGPGATADDTAQADGAAPPANDPSVPVLTPDAATIRPKMRPETLKKP